MKPLRRCCSTWPERGSASQRRLKRQTMIRSNTDEARRGPSQMPVYATLIFLCGCGCCC